MHVHQSVVVAHLTCSLLLLTVLLRVQIYAAITPFMLPVGALFFAGAYCVHLFQVQVYVDWTFVYICTIVALLLHFHSFIEHAHCVKAMQMPKTASSLQNPCEAACSASHQAKCVKHIQLLLPAAVFTLNAAD
jgi:hypothetical protein